MERDQGFLTEELQQEFESLLENKNGTKFDADWGVVRPLIKDKLTGMGFKEDELPNEEGWDYIKHVHHFHMQMQIDRHSKDEDTLGLEQDAFNDYVVGKHSTVADIEAVKESVREIRGWTG